MNLRTPYPLRQKLSLSLYLSLSVFSLPFFAILPDEKGRVILLVSRSQPKLLLLHFAPSHAVVEKVFHRLSQDALE